MSILENLLTPVPLDDITKVFGLNILFSALTIAFILILRIILVRIIPLKTKQKNDVSWKKKSYYITSVIGIILLFLIWLPHLTTFLTIFSIIGTGLVVVLKEVFLNIAGWFYLVLRRPFEIGNRISLSEFTGDVIDIRLLEFSMIEVSSQPEGGQSTGRVIRVPNALLFTNPLVNASKDFSLCWNEIRIKLEIKSNWNKASIILESLAHDYLDQIYKSDERLQQAEKKYLIKYNKIDPKVYISYSDESVNLTLRHLSEPKKMRDINDKLWRAILIRFRKEKDIFMK